MKKKADKRGRHRPSLHKSQTSTKNSPSPERGLRWIVGTSESVLVATIVLWFARSGHHAIQAALPQSPTISASAPVLPKNEPSTLANLAGPAGDLLQIKEEELRLAHHMMTSFPQNEDAFVLLGNVLYQHCDLPKAMDVWTRALALNPRRVDIYQKLGTAAEGQGDPNQALLYWKKALEGDRNRPTLRWYMAKVYMDQGAYEQGADLLEQECKLSPRAARNFFLLGQAYLQLKDYDKAISNYERAIELYPDGYNAYYGLASVYLRLKDRDRAQAFMQRFRELKKTRDARPENQVKVDEVPDARKRMARRYVEAYSIYQKAKRRQAGETLIRRAVRLDPANPSHLERLGAHYCSLQRLPEALRVFDVARKIYPNNPLFYLNISKIYVAQQRLDQAEQILAQTIARFPSNGLAYAEFAQFYLQTRPNAPQALALAQRAVQYQASVSHYFLLSWASDVNRDYAGALRAIEKAIALAPKNQKFRTLHERIKQKM